MSFYYVKTNGETSKELFEKRTIYRGTVGGSVEHTNLVDFNFAEKFFYGRTSEFFVPITVNRAFLGIKNFKVAPANTAVNFVVDAFEDMAKQYNKCASTGYINADDTYLSRLTVYNARVDPDVLYGSYLTNYHDSMKKVFKGRPTPIRNFDEFIVEFKSLIKASGRRLPFTKPAFIKSRWCPINCSGLAVEIADLDASNDEDKIDQFVNSPNWEFYVNACRSFGFMVDQFVPWRMVADIASAPMIEYAKVYNFNNTRQILNLGYGRVHNEYFSKFKYYLLDLYNKMRVKAFVEPQECNGETVFRRVRPQTYTIEQLSNIYSEEYFLELYFGVRFIEEESHFEEFEQKMLIDNCLEVYQNQGTSHALGVFERILNKPFDYRGSLSYINEYLQTISAVPI